MNLFVLIKASISMEDQMPEKVGRGISRRKTPKELVNGMDLKKPVIVLDHEPRQLEELNQAGVDIDLCGHTHDGQLFPGNITIHLFWKNPYGYRKVGNAHQIVTYRCWFIWPEYESERKRRLWL